MSSAADQLSPRIYVACLAAYNAGCLHGAWIDIEDEETVKDAIEAMLTASPVAGAEEFAIHDYDGFGGVSIGEYEPIGRVVEIAGFLRERGQLGALVLEHLGGSIDDATAALEDGYRGTFESLADYFQELTEETTTIPEPLRPYIDYEAMARDAELSGDVCALRTAHDEMHVFWAR
ncbi:antirestriction protein ArdA [Caulobacter sp.]|uniref:antirestriction protein ArdA n=1 Tax=Caulobacter sp. TaxID=78 RepID=UPI001B2CF7A2|nr:antirestriction protein ArdA [Caulobacter sp.]MBO9545638.1 antirestriction protein ArdA [Caulobacter sp.]